MRLEEGTGHLMDQLDGRPNGIQRMSKGKIGVVDLAEIRAFVVRDFVFTRQNMRALIHMCTRILAPYPSAIAGVHLR